LSARSEDRRGTEQTRGSDENKQRAANNRKKSVLNGIVHVFRLLPQAAIFSAAPPGQPRLFATVRGMLPRNVLNVAETHPFGQMKRPAFQEKAGLMLYKLFEAIRLQLRLLLRSSDAAAGAMIVAIVKSRSITVVTPFGRVTSEMWMLSPIFLPLRSMLKNSGMASAGQ
jgi:hypothetical protein